jgi:hypothetical protein
MRNPNVPYNSPDGLPEDNENVRVEVTPGNHSCAAADHTPPIIKIVFRATSHNPVYLCEACAMELTNKLIELIDLIESGV